MKLTIVSDNRVLGLGRTISYEKRFIFILSTFFSIYTAHNHSFVSPLCPVTVYVGSSPLCLG